MFPDKKKSKVTEVELPAVGAIADFPPTIPMLSEELELIAKTYAPPVIHPDSVKTQLTAEELERSVFGVTTLLFKTQNNDFIRHELLGSDEGRTEDLCAKVERFGPQYVTHNGGTYVIARLMAQDGTPQ